MSVFGWSLPPGVTTLPGEEPILIACKCRLCGRFVSWTPTRSEPYEVSFINDYGEKEIVWADSHHYYNCTKCGETKEVDEIYV